MKSFSLLLLYVALFSFSTQAQIKQKRNCDTAYGLSLVQQQIDDSKVVESSDKRVQMLVRAADFFWEFDEERARSMFTEALTIARARFKEKGEETGKDGNLTIQMPDYRFMVLNAIAKRDSKWAKKLIDETVKEAEEIAKENANKKKGIYDSADHIVRLAETLLETDIQNALNFARMALNYPLTRYGVPVFLSRLPEKDQAIADAFFVEILNAKSNSPVKELLYISAYPFGFQRIIGPEAMQTFNFLKPEFVPNTNLQRLFINTLLQRATLTLSRSNDITTDVSLQSDAEYLFIALSELEPIIAERFPDNLEKMARARDGLNLILTPQSRTNAANTAKQREQTKLPPKTLDERLEEIEKESNPDKRDFLIAQIFFGAMNADEEKLKPLEPLIDKIADSNARQQVSDHFYFHRTKAAIKDNRLEDAAKYAAKVTPLEQRASLSFEIAEYSLKNNNDKDKAIEILNEAKTAALRAENSIPRARALLGIAFLYENFDHSLALESFNEAVKTINKLKDPNLSSSSVNRKIELKYGAYYASYSVSGYSMEKTLLALGAEDFDSMISKVKELDDRFLRITAIIALVNDCIEKPKPKQKPTNKTTKPKTKSQ